MANENDIEFNLKFKGDAKKGINDTEKALKDLGLTTKTVGEVMGGSFGSSVKQFGRFGKDLGELTGKFPALAVAAVGVGVAIGATALIFKQFFGEALHQSPALAASFEQLKERVAALTSWIASKLAPAFKWLVDVALQFLPDFTAEMGDNTEETRKNSKAISEWKDSHIKALAAVGAYRATQARDVGNDFAYQSKLRDEKYKYDVLALKNKQKQELTTLIAGTKEYNEKVAQQKEDLTTLDFNHKMEALKATQDHQKDITDKTLALTHERDKSIADLRKEGKLKELDLLEIEEAKELEQKELTEDQKTLILQKYSNKRQLINRQESVATTKIWASGLSAIGGVFGALEQLMANHTHKSKELRNQLRLLLYGQTVMNTAAAIMNVWADPTAGNYWMKIAETAAVGLTGAAQLATISQQQFATGGIIGGGQQSIIVNEQGTESVLNARATAMLGAEGVNDLNRGKGLGGNITVHYTVMINGHADSEVIAKALQENNPRLTQALKTAGRDGTRKRQTA